LKINPNPVMMKPVILSRILLLSAAIVISAVTCNAQNDLSDQLVGKWTKTLNGRTLTLTISSELTFEVEFVGDEERDVWGSCEVSGTHITFKDEGGAYSSGAAGEYEFKVSGTSIAFTKVLDPVDGRSMLVEGTWSKAGGASN
jgi:hypothetical protein